MRLWKRISELLVSHKLILANNAQIVQLDQAGKEQPFSGGGIEGLTATATELNRSSDVSERLVSITGDTLLTIEEHEGRTLLLNISGGGGDSSIQLPAATGSGARYRFVFTTENTGQYTFIESDENAILVGSVLTIKRDGSPSPELIPWLAESADSMGYLEFDALNQGGRVGDWIELEDVATNLYEVRGMTTSSGVVASPFQSNI